MTTAVIALGSNLDNPEKQIIQAAQHIAALPEILSYKMSSLYRSTPVGYVHQPDFINAVALVETTFNAPQLLDALQNIEQIFGRKRSFQNAPRTLDLDIIDFNHEIWQTNTLTLPHPRAHQRVFVMHPLAEIAPNYQLNKQGTAKEIAAYLGQDGIWAA